MMSLPEFLRLADPRTRKVLPPRDCHVLPLCVPLMTQRRGRRGRHVTEVYKLTSMSDHRYLESVYSLNDSLGAPIPGTTVTLIGRDMVMVQWDRKPKNLSPSPSYQLLCKVVSVPRPEPKKPLPTPAEVAKLLAKHSIQVEAFLKNVTDVLTDVTKLREKVTYEGKFKFLGHALSSQEADQVVDALKKAGWDVVKGYIVATSEYAFDLSMPKDA